MVGHSPVLAMVNSKSGDNQVSFPVFSCFPISSSQTVYTETTSFVAWNVTCVHIVHDVHVYTCIFMYDVHVCAGNFAGSEVPSEAQVLAESSSSV